MGPLTDNCESSVLGWESKVGFLLCPTVSGVGSSETSEIHLFSFSVEPFVYCHYDLVQN